MIGMTLADGNLAAPICVANGPNRQRRTHLGDAPDIKKFSDRLK